MQYLLTEEELLKRLSREQMDKERADRMQEFQLAAVELVRGVFEITRYQANRVFDHGPSIEESDKAKLFAIVERIAKLGGIPVQELHRKAFDKKP